ncbi:hypothetical protein [Mycobacterium sp.]|uniref:hypothetical protein n=1 Tax=Mycobacterium sp. TaxID=1785 RepID=UPI003C78C455
MPTAPVFTLGSALRWLGHDCPDRRCSQPIDASPTSMWFLRRGHPLPTYPLQAVLVVDLAETGEPLARTHRLIDEVDRCTRGETIRVRRRHSSGNGLELIALQMNRTPLVWCPAGGRGQNEQNVGRFEIAVQDPGVVSHRENPRHVIQDRTHRRCLRMVH